MPSDIIKDKVGQGLHEGDYIFTNICGGSHQGKVVHEKIVTDEAAAKQEDVQNLARIWPI
ncbi:hypothetical protein BJX99DRAFT_225478 [Aspergillus californicus]